MSGAQLHKDAQVPTVLERSKKESFQLYHSTIDEILL
jgi:hypothetical protein